MALYRETAQLAVSRFCAQQVVGMEDAIYEDFEGIIHGGAAVSREARA